MSKNKIILNAACRKFIKENKNWRNDDPIGFELELLEKFGLSPKENINPDDLITMETLDKIFDENGEQIKKENK